MRETSGRGNPGDFGRGDFYEDFDYANGCTQQLVFDTCRYWLDEYQLDGIRFDFTTGYYRPEDPGRGIARLVADLNARFGRVGTLLLRDDGIVAKLFQLLELFGSGQVWTTCGVRRDPTHAAVYTEKPRRRQSRAPLVGAARAAPLGRSEFGRASPHAAALEVIRS